MRLTLPEVVPIAQAYMERYPHGGSLHLALEDFNLSDKAIEFCAGIASENGDIHGKNLADMMLRLTQTQRKKLVRMI